MKAVLGQHPLLDYLDSFRYPLAGEISMTTDLARINRIPSDWGLEIGTLVEVYRNCSQKRICQVELTENYDHRHQDLSEHDATRGLHRMVRDIASSAIRNLASYGVAVRLGLPEHAHRRLPCAPRRTRSRPYSDDAALNGLVFDRHEEEFAVETFSGALRARRPRLRARPDGGPADPELEPRRPPRCPTSSTSCARRSTPTPGRQAPGRPCRNVRYLPPA